ncbi:MAG: hypothetical protein AB4352_25250 [Hormoscilla sp.]
MIKWDLSEYDQDQLVGLDFEEINSGYIEVADNNGSDSISIPFLWWWPSYSYSASFNFYSYYDSSVQESFDDLRYIQVQLSEDPSESYYLVIPELDENVFSLLDGAEITSEDYEVMYEEGALEQLLNENYKLIALEEEELYIPDMVGYVNQAKPAPEPSSALGVLVFGMAFVGVLIKRGWSKLTR